MQKQIIDVSHHNGEIDWNLVKPHISGAIIRCGYGDDISSQDDTQWSRNSAQCEKLGIPYGVYLYSYAATQKQAASEAAHVLRLIKGKHLSLPVYWDMEEDTIAKLTTSQLEDFYQVFRSQIQKSISCKVGIYSNDNNFKTKLKGDVFGRDSVWIARYAAEKPEGRKFDIWQYTSKGSVPGISGNVDMNYLYDESLLGAVPSPALKTNMMGQRGPTPVRKYSMLYDSRVQKLQIILKENAGYTGRTDGVAEDTLYTFLSKNYTVHEKDRGNLIRWTQERLNDLGYDAGYADGYAESPTMNGIARFQNAYGLGVGYLGGTDWYYMIES